MNSATQALIEKYRLRVMPTRDSWTVTSFDCSTRSGDASLDAAVDRCVAEMGVVKMLGPDERLPNDYASPTRTENAMSQREYFAAHADVEWEHARKCARLQFGPAPTNDQVLGMRATLAVGYADQLLKALRYG